MKRKVEAVVRIKETYIELVWDSSWTPDRILGRSKKRITE
jgi:metal-sulfur cluster biosynthetic enzyme